MFNMTKQLAFYSETNTNVSSIEYSGGYLKIGNNQINFKNNNLDFMKVYSSTVFGECYFNSIKNR